MNEIDLSRAEIQNIVPASAKKPAIDVLRLDLIHPVVSGNKYFKLRFYIDEALRAKASGLITFGGAWSNHIVATAFLASQNNLAAIGIIRGERPPILSPTLREAQQCGMELQFVNRDEYRDLVRDPTPIALPGWMIVPEGGTWRNRNCRCRHHHEPRQPWHSRRNLLRRRHRHHAKRAHPWRNPGPAFYGHQRSQRPGLDISRNRDNNFHGVTKGFHCSYGIPLRGLCAINTGTIRFYERILCYAWHWNRLCVHG